MKVEDNRFPLGLYQHEIFLNLRKLSKAIFITSVFQNCSYGAFKGRKETGLNFSNGRLWTGMSRRSVHYTHFFYKNIVDKNTEAQIC